MTYDKKMYMKEWRKKNKDHIKAYKTRYNAENKDKVSKWNHDKYLRHKNEYLKKHKEYLDEHRAEVNERRRTYKKRKTDYAGNKLNYAVRTGEIKRRPCEVCGATEAEAHHDNYNNPLEIRWLCKAHHSEWHRKNKPIYKEEE